MGKLTDTGIKALKEPGRFGDGDGLYLFVSKGGSKSWVIRTQKDGRRRDIGLGGYPKTSLSNARKNAEKVREQADAGLDPVVERQRAAEVPTFEAAAKLVHAEHRKGWRKGKHEYQWLRTLEVYAFPNIGRMKVSDIDQSHVRDVVAPIWLEKEETARRVFQRIRSVLDWAHAKQYREAELPTRAVLRGLPRQTREVEHFKALPIDEMPVFMERLREQETISRLALEALILTATRCGSLRKATWDQIDFDKALWTIPDENMKKNKTHVVPLSAPALAAFRRAEAHRRPRTELVFPGVKFGQTLSENTLNQLVERLGFDATAHGFRSTFDDWASERTNHPRHVVEMALAHAIPNKVEAAYRRGNLLEKRRALMDAWGHYCTDSASKVIRLSFA